MSPEHWPGDAGDLIASDPYGQFLARLEAAVNAALDAIASALCLPPQPHVDLAARGIEVVVDE